MKDHSLNGDLERAFRILAPQDAVTEARIAALLGYLGKATPATEARQPAPRQAPELDEVDVLPKRMPVPKPESEPVPRGDPRSAVLRQLTSAPVAAAPEWLSVVAPLEKPSGRVVELPAPPPLFAPAQARTILSMALSTSREGGHVLVDRVVAAIARGDALRHIPREMVPSMAPSVLLLVDRSEAMLPFVSDVNQIERDFETLFGTMLRTISFSASPMRKAWAGPRSVWSDFFPTHVPREGGRVICLTDLGIGHPPGALVPAEPEEWLEFHRLLRKNRCSLVVLNPYGPSRWSPLLAKRLRILHWDRRTTAAGAATTLKKH